MAASASKRRTTEPVVQQIDQHELLSVRQAASVLKIGEAYCWKLVRAGTIPSRRIGRRVLVKRSDLADFTANLPAAYES